MFATMRPNVTCRFWQAPYSNRPQVGPIGPMVPFRKVAAQYGATLYDSDVEDDPTYHKRGYVPWVSLEEEICVHEAVDDVPAIVFDSIGDVDLLDTVSGDDEYDDVEEYYPKQERRPFDG